MKTALLLLGIELSLGLSAAAGNFVGNGGDHIRANYLLMGQAVLSHLTDTVEGNQIVDQSHLDLNLLKETLDISKVTVTLDDLRDNTGSIVEAIGVPGKVTLNQEAWAKHFELETDVYYLVFHEMLRSAAVNDDNYVISKAICPFPQGRRVDTRITPTVPLIEDDLLSGIFNLKSVSVGGSGCSSNLGSLRLDFDQEKNILEIRPSQFRVDLSSGHFSEQKSCQLAIPVNLPKGKRLVISQLDLSGKIDLRVGATAKLNFEAFLAGSSAPVKTKIFQPKDSLKGRFLMRRTEVLKSRCGLSDILRLNSSLSSQITSAQPTSQTQADQSVEVQALSLFLSVESCQ